MAIKDAERTVQYVQSDRGLFVAGARFRGYQNNAGPDLPMRPSKHSRHSLDSRHVGIHASPIPHPHPPHVYTYMRVCVCVCVCVCV